MSFRRPIWLAAFFSGLVGVASLVHMVDAWAAMTALPGAERLCRGSLVQDIAVTSLPTCAAVWVVEAKSWFGFALDALRHVPQHGPGPRGWLRVAEILVYVSGSIAAAVMLATLWANALIRIAAYHALLADQTLRQLRPQASRG